ncbi:MAG: DUF2807 domain-containing protein [Tannerellaceae bacterium]|nr:DUF2807 domain-containing protein [Tannerellaceae bacterium]
MKTRIFLLISFCCLMACHTAKPRGVKGGGKTVTKEFSVGDYTSLSIGGVRELVYEQKSGKPFLEITIDENVLSYLNVEEKGKKLIVNWKKQGNREPNVSPAVFRVRTNSKELVEASLAGSGEYTLKNIQGERNVKISHAGSGRLFIQSLKGNHLDLSVAGSGRVDATSVQVKSLKSRIAGSGKIEIEGTAESADFSTAGSGNVYAENFRVQDVKASSAGSGTLRVHATVHLKASTAGSGNVYFKGSPSLNSSVAGSGKIQSID